MADQNLYVVKLVKDGSDEVQVGILQAGNFFEAEEKAKEAATVWQKHDPKWKYWGTFYEERKPLDAGEVLWL